MVSKLTLGPKEADMLMDALVTLQGDWDAGLPVTPTELRRADELMRKLYAIYHNGNGHGEQR